MRIFNTMAAHAIPIVPRSLIRKISRRYIAGETLCDVRTRIQALHAAGFRTTVDVLGETASSSDQADSMTREYLDLVQELGSKNEPTELSIKLTALGIHLDEGACMARVLAILRAAASHGINASSRCCSGCANRCVTLCLRKDLTYASMCHMVVTGMAIAPDESRKIRELPDTSWPR